MQNIGALKVHGIKGSLFLKWSIIYTTVHLTNKYSNENNIIAKCPLLPTINRPFLTKLSSLRSLKCNSKVWSLSIIHWTRRQYTIVCRYITQRPSKTFIKSIYTVATSKKESSDSKINVMRLILSKTSLKAVSHKFSETGIKRSCIHSAQFQLSASP